MVFAGNLQHPLKDQLVALDAALTLGGAEGAVARSEEHTSELQSP